MAGDRRRRGAAQRRRRSAASSSCDEARRWPRSLLAPLAGAALAIVASLGASALAPAAKLRTTAVGVSLREYRLTPYRTRVLPGRVRFNIENFGEDAHDLRVIGPGAASAIRATSPEVKPARATR